jgi:hypothetical protein
MWSVRVFCHDMRRICVAFLVGRPVPWPPRHARDCAPCLLGCGPWPTFG